MADQLNIQEQSAQKKGHVIIPNYLPFLEQEQIWINNKQEKLTIAEALGFRIYELEKRIFITQKEVEEINTLTKILSRLGYDVHEKKSGEWTRAHSKSELFHRVKKEESEA
jgi:hypothetical protein